MNATTNNASRVARRERSNGEERKALPAALGSVPLERWAITALAAINQRDMQLTNAKTSLRAAAWGEAAYAVFEPELSRELLAASETIDRSLELLRTVRNEVYSRRFEPMAALVGTGLKGEQS